VGADVKLGLDEGRRGGHREDTYGIAFRVAPAGSFVCGDAE
jgi:hypothetical protein